MKDDVVRSSEWMSSAACKDVGPDPFYVEAPHTHAGDEARAICEACPVRRQCLDYAIANHEPAGIWGGKTWRQRRRIITDRRRAMAGEKPRGKPVAIRGPGGRFIGSVAQPEKN